MHGEPNILVHEEPPSLPGDKIRTLTITWASWMDFPWYHIIIPEIEREKVVRWLWRGYWRLSVRSNRREDKIFFRLKSLGMEHFQSKRSCRIEVFKIVGSLEFLSSSTCISLWTLTKTMWTLGSSSGRVRHWSFWSYWKLIIEPMRILFDFFSSWPNNHVISTYLLVTTTSKPISL